MIIPDTSPTMRQRRPLWEEIHPNNIHDLIGLIAGEVWQRTREPACQATFAEAAVAHLHSGGSWHTLSAIGDLAYAQGMERADQAAVVGLYATTIIRARRGVTSAEEVCTKAMHYAGLVPMSSEEREACDARSAAADAERRRLSFTHPDSTGEGVPS